MTFVRYRPPAPLNRYVEWLWWSARETPQLHGEHMLPSASTQLIIALHDGAYSWQRTADDDTPTVWTHGIVHGPQWSYFVSGPKPGGAVVGVAFRPGAASALLAVPMTELTDRHVPIDALWGARGRSLRQQLRDAEEPMAALRVLEQDLVSRLTRPLLIHPAIAHALADPVHGWGFTRIAHVQREAGLSPRHFIALFRDAVGLTPKHYYRVKRFTAALPRMAGGAAPSNLADLAASSGYADQSHLTREFREFAGITPTEYRPRDSDSLLHHRATDPSPRPREGKKSSRPGTGDGRR